MASVSSDSKLEDLLAFAIPVGGALFLAYTIGKRPAPAPTPSPPTPVTPVYPPEVPPEVPPEKKITVRITNFPDGVKPGELARGTGIVSTNFDGSVTLRWGIKDKPETFATATINVTQGDTPFNFGIVIPTQIKPGTYTVFVTASDGVMASTERSFVVLSPAPPEEKPRIEIKNIKILKVPNGYIPWGGDGHVVLGATIDSNVDTILDVRIDANLYDTYGRVVPSTSSFRLPVKKGTVTYSFDMLFRGEDTKKLAPNKSYPLSVRFFISGKKVYENTNVGEVMVKTTTQPAKIRINKLWIEPPDPMVGQKAIVHSSITADVVSGTQIRAEIYHDGKLVTSGNILIQGGATIDVAHAIPNPIISPSSVGTHTVKLVVYSNSVKADEKTITYESRSQGELQVSIVSLSSPVYQGGTGSVKIRAFLPTTHRPTIYAYIDNVAVIRGASPSVSSSGWNEFSYKFNVPAISEGTHTFKVVLTQDNKTVEDSKSITVKKQTARISIKNVRVDKTVVRKGEVFHVDFDIYNTGGSSWSGKATAYLRASRNISLGSESVHVSPGSHVHVRFTGVYPSQIAGETATVVAGAYDTISAYASGPSIKIEKPPSQPPEKVYITSFSISPVSGDYRVGAGKYGRMKVKFNIRTSKPDNVKIHVDITSGSSKLTSYDYIVNTGRVTSFTKELSYPIPKNWSGVKTITAKAYAVTTTGDKKNVSTSWRIEVV